MARCAAIAALMFGTSAIAVPKMVTISTPIHIHATSGFRNALITGWPVAGILAGVNHVKVPHQRGVVGHNR